MASRQLPTCVLCHCVKSALVQTGVRLAPMVKVYRCGRCGLAYLHPRPTPAQLRKYYTAQYRHDDGEPPVAQRFRRDMDEARTRVRRLLPLLSPKSRVLEMGSGSGAFLDAVRPYVADATGVEPDAAARSWIAAQTGARVEAELATLARAGATYDMVVSFHVLEHVADPVGFLASLRRRLRPAGRLVTEVPNVDDALVGLYQVPAYRPFYYQKSHLYYFSADTLRRALKAAGLTAEIVGVQRYDLSNHLHWMLQGQPGGQGRYSEMLTAGVNAVYADALIRAGRSDTLWAIGQSADE